MSDILELYREQGVSEALLKDIAAFREKYPVEAAVSERVMRPEIRFYGKEIFEMAATALLQGENILLSGTKATGKNVLAENLAWAFGRPVYNISFNINTDSASLIGTDTFRNNEVCLRRGPVYDCAVYGGFGIFDEINMAKNDAVSVLHAALDYRRMIDVPGYERIVLHDAARFIGTMNYGYAGTKELNEALVSRFMVIDMPPMKEETLLDILTDIFPDAKREGLLQLAGFFMDLQLKASHNEISTKPLDLRGLIGAIRTIRAGLSPAAALRMGMVNKSFDVFERDMIEDILETRIPEGWESSEVFEGVRKI
ncbi:MoxR family ATPase [Marvinbryantia formatexigens DSM 14469]|nr:MoxR family ATPase [Marvinbryantia formatexigens]UWO26436.1 MoxR family ATPase [Marvinbryantia formatexigens DSM 14469]SDF81068.1 MoxR-like ATPase [Marvinbryantia formatexigens]